jgi:uncharacterized membrane protein YgcG
MPRQPRPDRELARYLVSGEKVVVAVRRHWFHMIRQIALLAASTILALWVDVVTPSNRGGDALRNLTLVAFWISAGWFVWSALNWRHDWFVATDKRFLLFYGFIRRKVAMMPLLRVTDMTFDRTLLGRLVGYGTFVLESAGQDQALSVIDHVPNAHLHYRAICLHLFGSPEAENQSGAGGRDSPGSGDDGAGGGSPGGGEDGTGSGPAAVTPRRSGRYRPGGSITVSPVRVSGRGHPSQRRREPESWYRSSSLRASRAGDTGEIPVIRSVKADDDTPEYDRRRP